jgi:nitroreductase
MNLGDALKGRRSVRRYEPRSVPREIVQNLIDAAETAPSAGNLRARKYVAVTNPEILKALAVAAYGQDQLKTAPLVIVTCADVDRSSTRYGDRGSLFAILDAASATMCLLLKACDLGLGACWNGAFDDDLVRDLLGLEEHMLPVALISVGWPSEVPQASPKRDIDEVLIWMD